MYDRHAYDNYLTENDPAENEERPTRCPVCMGGFEEEPLISVDGEALCSEACLETYEHEDDPVDESNDDPDKGGFR